MVDINNTLEMLEPFSVTVQGFMDIIKILVGGIFGLYVIMLVVKIYYSVKYMKAMESFTKELKQLRERITGLEKKLSKKR